MRAILIDLKLCSSLINVIESENLFLVIFAEDIDLIGAISLGLMRITSKISSLSVEL